MTGDPYDPLAPGWSGEGDPELAKLARLRAEQWGCSFAEAVARLMVAPVRVVSTDPPVAIVSSAEIGRMGGTLDARYWVERQGEETPAQYRRRMQALDCVRRAEAHERTAARLREEAAELLAGGDSP